MDIRVRPGSNPAYCHRRGDRRGARADPAKSARGISTTVADGSALARHGSYIYAGNDRLLEQVRRLMSAYFSQEPRGEMGREEWVRSTLVLEVEVRQEI